jgi:hypothetical protein
VSTVVNPYESAARERKASALATVLILQGLRAEQVARLDRAGRRATEQLSGVNKASEPTWQRVIEILVKGTASVETDRFNLLPERRSA